jgi:allantoate deiminase
MGIDPARATASSMDHTPSATRILEHCDALARCSEQPDGLTRVFLSDEQRAADGLVLGWMRAAGMSARLDAIGNCVGRYEGERAGMPALLLGSHLDTVRDAGRYDGMLGVVAAIECVHALSARGRRLPFAIEVIGFADEEGVRFGSTLLGSRAVAGTLDQAVLDTADQDGVTMREALLRFGLDPAHVRAAARSRDDVLAYAELHIEQGPVLEADGLPVGVVTAINGANRLRVELHGVAGHAGTVPMRLRKDALAAAAECVLAVERRCASAPDLVGTVGRLAVLPGATNVIPGKVTFTIDVRSPRDVDRRAATDDVVQAIEAICAKRGVSPAITRTHEGVTAECAPWLRAQIGRAVAAEGLPVRELPSGAGHDAMALVDLADVGMLFVRCEAGVSHNPAEAITAEDVATSARVFLRFIEQFRPERPNASAAR